MFISTIIHTLEAVTGLLTVFLGYRVTQCYKAYYQPEAISPLARASLSKSPLQYFAPGLSGVESAEDGPDIEVNAKLKPVARTAAVGSETILVDYIGGFFGESAVADIQPYKASSPEPTTVAEHVVEEFLVVPDEFRAVSDTVAGTAANEKDAVVVLDSVSPALLVPVLVDQVMLDEADDDTFIMVETEGTEASSVNVMSDKVVHAMLDEAKLVCVS